MGLSPEAQEAFDTIYRSIAGIEEFDRKADIWGAMDDLRAVLCDHTEGREVDGRCRYCFADLPDDPRIEDYLDDLDPWLIGLRETCGNRHEMGATTYYCTRLPGHKGTHLWNVRGTDRGPVHWD